MNVVDIIKLTATYLQLNDLLNTTTLGGSVAPTSDNIKDIDLLVSCVNLTNSVIASEYIRLKAVKEVTTLDGKVNYTDINANLHEILKITNEQGNRVVYKNFDSYVKTVVGKLYVEYSYLPQSVSISDSINNYKTKISPRVFAYGVASEYCFIKSLYDDAAMWDARFKSSLVQASTKKGEVVVKPRRWI